MEGSLGRILSHSHYNLTMQRRLAKEARAQEIQAKNAALGKKVKDTPASKGVKGRGEASFYRVTCKVRMVSAPSFFYGTILMCIVFLMC